MDDLRHNEWRIYEHDGQTVIVYKHGEEGSRPHKLPVLSDPEIDSLYTALTAYRSLREDV